MVFSLLSQCFGWVLYAKECTNLDILIFTKLSDKEGATITEPFYTCGNLISNPSCPTKKWWRQDPYFHPWSQMPSLFSCYSQAPSSWQLFFPFLPMPPKSWLHFLPFIHPSVPLKINLKPRLLWGFYCTSLQGNGPGAKNFKGGKSKVYSLGRWLRSLSPQQCFLDPCPGLSSPKPGSSIHNLIWPYLSGKPLFCHIHQPKKSRKHIRSRSRISALSTAKNKVTPSQKSGILGLLERWEMSALNPRRTPSGARKKRLDQCHFMSTRVQSDPREEANALTTS